MISNVTTNQSMYWPSAGSGIKSVNANAISFQSMLQSHQANSSFGIGSVGTKTIIASPLQMKGIAPFNASANISKTSVSAASPVFDENASMEDYLDTYKRIYDKYAAIYGDGFEFTVRYSFEGNAESMAAERKVGQMLDDFHRELHANIPSKFLSCTDPDFKLKAAEEGLTLREAAEKYGFDSTKPVGDSYAPDNVTKMFYLEKYGLDGLSAQEQINKIMSQFGKGSFHDLNKGIGILHSVGAITGDEARMTISEAISYVRNEELGKALEMYDSNSWEEFFKQYYANIIFHMNRMYSEEYDWIDVFNNQSSGPYAGKVAKLFG